MWMTQGQYDSSSTVSSKLQHFIYHLEGERQRTKGMCRTDLVLLLKAPHVK